MGRFSLCHMIIIPSVLSNFYGICIHNRVNYKTAVGRLLLRILTHISAIQSTVLLIALKVRGGAEQDATHMASVSSLRGW